jgi:hypothetical protein
LQGKTKDTGVRLSKEDMQECMEMWKESDIRVGEDERAVLSGTLHRISVVSTRIETTVEVFIATFSRRGYRSCAIENSKRSA